MAKDTSSTFKQDSAPVLFHGTGAPYLAIFNGQSKPILCQKNKLPIGTFVKGFEYKYVEEGPDVGEIMIETDNPDLLDHPDLQYYSSLWIQWGYIYANKTCLPGPPRKVIIIGMSSEFTDKGTTINLKVADVGILLKTVPSNFYNNLKGLEDFLKDLLQGEFVGETSLIDYAEVDSKPIPVIMESVDPEALKGETEPLWAQGDVGMDHKQYASVLNHDDKVLVHNNILPPHRVVPHGNNVVLLEWNPSTATLAQQLSETYQQGWAKKLDVRVFQLTGISKTKYQQFQEFISGLDHGPFTMDLRDGKLVIHNRDTQRPTYKTYTYTGGNGELLYFSVDSDFVTKAVEISKSVELDPVDKSIKTNVVQGLNNPQQGNLDGWVTGNKGIPPIHDRDNTKVNTPPRDLLEAPLAVNLDGSYQDPYQYLDNTPTEVKAMYEFPSVKAAKTYINNNISKYISEEDIKNWFKNFVNDFDQWIKSDDLEKSVQNLQEIPNYELRLKVKIQRVEIPDVIATGIMLLQTGKSTEELANLLKSGEMDFDTLGQASWASTSGLGGAGTKYNSKGAWTIKGKNYGASEAVNVVQTVITQAGGNFTYSESSRDYNATPQGFLNHRYIKGTASMEVEIELPIAGTRLLGDPRFKGSISAMESDIEQTVTDQMTATGIFIGDPIIETSFNINIQNVSKRYSGIWYTKEVIHRLSPEEGYRTECTFVQRAVPVSTRVIKSNWSHSDFAKNIHEMAKKALEPNSGYSKKSEVLQDLKTKFRESNTSHAAVQVDDGTLHVKAKSDLTADLGYEKVQIKSLQDLKL